MASKVSTPGRVIFGGDHAREVGGRMIVGAIDLRVTIEITRRSDDIVEIQGPFLPHDVSKDGIFSEANSVEELTVSKSDREFPVFSLIRRVVDELDIDSSGLPGFNIDISVEDRFPLGEGLASSSAVSVAIIAALADEFDERLAYTELIDIATDIETEFWDDSLPVDPAVIVRGGFVLGNPSPIDSAAYDCPLILGIVKTRPNRQEIRTRVEKLRARTGELYKSVESFSDEATEEIWQSIQDNDCSGILPFITFYGGLLEVLGYSSWPVPQVRAAELAHNDFELGAKQSDFGKRAILVAVTGETANIDELVHAIERTGGDAIQTKTTSAGLTYLG